MNKKLNFAGQTFSMPYVPHSAIILCLIIFGSWDITIAQTISYPSGTTFTQGYIPFIYGSGSSYYFHNSLLYYDGSGNFGIGQGSSTYPFNDPKSRLDV